MFSFNLTVCSLMVGSDTKVKGVAAWNDTRFYYSGVRLPQFEFRASQCWLANWLLRPADVWRRAVLLCALKMVRSARLLHFLPALSSAGKQICKWPGVSQQDTRAASSPAALWHRLVVSVLFHWVRLYQSAKVDFCQAHTHMGGRNITWKHTCELPKRFRDQFHLPACDKVQFSPGIFQVWLLFSHVTFHFAAFPRGSKHKIGDYMSDGGQPSDQSHVLGTLGWRFSRQALWESIQAVTQPDGWARYGTEGDIYSRVTSRNQRVSAPGGHPAWIYLKESCLFSIIFYHQCSCWSSNQIELVKTWFFFLL